MNVIYMCIAARIGKICKALRRLLSASLSTNTTLPIFVNLAIIVDLRSYRDLLSQARTWEQSGEHSRAVDVYLQVTSSNCPDPDVLQDSWEKAVDLTLKFVSTRSVDVVTLVSDRLAHLGRYVQVTCSTRICYGGYH